MRIALLNKKNFILLAITILLTIPGLVPVSHAITNGQPDSNEHPYVGLIVFDVQSGVPGWRCSGTLIAPNVVLTAGDCTDGAVAARVWFEEAVTDTFYPYGGGTSYEGTPHTHPDYRSEDNPYGGGLGLPALSYRDVGIVVLDEAVVGIDPADLPIAGEVDELRVMTDVDFVGYGLQYQEKEPGNDLPQPPPLYRWTGLKVRLYAPTKLLSGNFVHSDEFLKLSLNSSKGKGGTCYGDSGGPDLLGGTDIILGVNSYGTNVNCSGVGYSSRIDIQEVLDWIDGFINP